MREYCGHGIGRVYHEDPQVLHYGEPGTGLELKPGMTFTIEPMVNAGRRHVRLLPDGWTVVTKDHSLSAQWEHTMLVTPTGCEVLTLGSRDGERWLSSRPRMITDPGLDDYEDPKRAPERPRRHWRYLQACNDTPRCQRHSVGAFRAALERGDAELKERFAQDEPVEAWCATARDSSMPSWSAPGHCTPACTDA